MMKNNKSLHYTTTKVDEMCDVMKYTTNVESGISFIEIYPATGGCNEFGNSDRNVGCEFTICAKSKMKNKPIILRLDPTASTLFSDSDYLIRSVIYNGGGMHNEIYDMAERATYDTTWAI
jgi:hypothetical protein